MSDSIGRPAGGGPSGRPRGLYGGYDLSWLEIVGGVRALVMAQDCSGQERRAVFRSDRIEKPGECVQYLGLGSLGMSSDTSLHIGN